MLLTRREAADYLRVSVGTIDKERRDGRLPWISIGRSVRISRDALDKYVRMQSGQAGTQERPIPENLGCGFFAGEIPTEEVCEIWNEVSPTPQEVAGIFTSEPEPSAFDFARFLIGRNISHASHCKTLVLSYCMRRGLVFEEFWLGFNQAWERVEYPDYGQDAFAVAAAHARDNPIRFSETPPEPARHYVTVASIAVSLHMYNKGRPFLLLVKRLAAELGLTEPRRVSDILWWLRKYRYIECVDETSRFGCHGARGKKYILGSNATKNIKSTKLLRPGTGTPPCFCPKQEQGDWAPNPMLPLLLPTCPRPKRREKVSNRQPVDDLKF